MFNNCFIIRVCFLMNILGKRSDLPFSRKSDRKKEKSTVSFTLVKNIICSQTQLDGMAHEQIIICRQLYLFADHVVGSRPMRRKKNLLRMIIWIILKVKKQFIIVTMYISLVFYLGRMQPKLKVREAFPRTFSKTKLDSCQIGWLV